MVDVAWSSSSSLLCFRHGACVVLIMAAGLWVQVFAFSSVTLTLTSTIGLWSTVGALVMFDSCYDWC